MTARDSFVLSGLLLLAFNTGTAADKSPRYTIRHVTTPIEIDGRLDEAAWKAVPSVGAFQFPWFKQGQREQTDARLLWDKQNLYVAFRCTDAHIWGVHTRHDDPVYRDDCVEVFTSPNPDHRESYFNIEMNVRGAFLDRHHPEGPEKKPPFNWNAQGVKIGITIQGTLNNDKDHDRSWTLEAAIPLANFKKAAKHTPPHHGDIWYMNLNRLGGETNPQFSQWSPGKTKTPQFHAPQYFGRVVFSRETATKGESPRR